VPQNILTAGYGEGATGYIPTEHHRAENEPNLGDWRWISPGSEPLLLDGIAKALMAVPKSR
jgi:hypothetical protein